MKHILLKISTLTLILAVFCTACNRHPFDFSNLDHIDADGSWGIPLATAQYSIGDIISHLDSVDYLGVAPDGGLKLQYEADYENLIKASDYMHFDGVQYHGEHTFQGADLPPLPDISVNLQNEAPIKLPADNLILEDAVIKTGTVSFSLTHNIPIATSITIVCNEITDAAGQALHLVFNAPPNNSFQHEVNLAGYHIVPADTNLMNFDLQVDFVTTDQPLPSTIRIAYNAQLSDLNLRELRGKLNSLDFDFSKQVDLNFDFGEIAGAITLFDPEIVFAVRNSFPLTGQCHLDTLAFTGNNAPPSSLISSEPLTIEIPVSPNAYAAQTIDGIQSITYNAEFNQFNIAGNLILNPAGFSGGTISLSEEAVISIRFSIIIPLKLRLDNVTFRDTLNREPIDTLGLNGISDLTLRIAATNALPLDMTMQVYFLNSQTGYSKAILTTPLILMGAYHDIPVQGTPVFATFDDIETINRLLSCDKIYIEAGVNTQGTVTFNTRQYLKARVSARFNTNLADLTNP